jgi:hypothetical protein
MIPGLHGIGYIACGPNHMVALSDLKGDNFQENPKRG